MAKSKKDNENQPEGNPGNSDDSADNFGLPDIEYKPLDREQEGAQVSHEPVQESEPEPVDSGGSDSGEGSDELYEDEPKSNAPVFIGLIIGVVVIVAGFLIYKYWYVPRGEKAKQEQLAKEAEEKRKADEARIAQEKEEAERKRLEAEAAAKAKPAEGTIETLSERTRRWFVIVTSDIDDDLVMDYAKKLSAKGVSTKIIPPYGKYKYYRLSIADFDTFNAAQSSADGSKGEYGNGLWVMKY